MYRNVKYKIKFYSELTYTNEENTNKLINFQAVTWYLVILYVCSIGIFIFHSKYFDVLIILAINIDNNIQFLYYFLPFNCIKTLFFFYRIQ